MGAMHFGLVGVGFITLSEAYVYEFGKSQSLRQNISIFGQLYVCGMLYHSHDSQKYDV